MMGDEAGKKKRPGLTVRFIEPPACWCSMCGRYCSCRRRNLGNGLSLAHNSAFATIARSMLPTCVFDSTRETFTLPFGLAPASRAPEVSAISTPLEAVSSPPDRSVQSLSPPEARRTLLSFRSADRSVNPGTESIMNHGTGLRQTKK